MPESAPDPRIAPPAKTVNPVAIAKAAKVHVGSADSFLTELTYRAMLKRLVFFMTASIGFVCLSVLFIRATALFSAFDLSKLSSLAASASGMTAPGIGLLSAILLFLALSEQTKATKQQAISIGLQLEANRQQNDQSTIELTHNLILQIEKNIESFFYTFNDPKSSSYSPIRFSGLEGLTKWCNSLKGLRGESKGIGVFYQAPLLILIIRSIIQIKKYIVQTQMTAAAKEQFLKKVELLSFVVQDPLKEMITALDNKRIAEDEFSAEVREFMAINR
jgi:hypothetical protein